MYFFGSASLAIWFSLLGSATISVGRMSFQLQFRYESKEQHHWSVCELVFRLLFSGALCEVLISSDLDFRFGARDSRDTAAATAVAAIATKECVEELNRMESI